MIREAIGNSRWPSGTLLPCAPAKSGILIGVLVCYAFRVTRARVRCDRSEFDCRFSSWFFVYVRHAALIIFFDFIN